MVTRLTARMIPDSWAQRSLRRNVVMNWTATLVSVVLSFVMTPLIVGALDKELFGVWTFLNNLTLYTNLFYLGLGASFMKRFSEAVGRDDTAVLTRLLGVAWTLYSALGALCLLIALVLSPILPRFFATPLAPASATAASVATALLGVRLLLTFVSSSYSAMLASHGRMDLLSAVAIIAALGRTAGAAGAMFLPRPLEGLAAVVVLEAVFQFAALVVLARLVVPQVRLHPARPTRAELADLYGFGFLAFFVQVALLVISYTDTAIIGVILGAAAVGLYSLPMQLIEYSRTLVNGITLALLPELSASRARGDEARLKSVYLRAARTCAALAAFINTHLVLLGPAFLAVWVGPEFAAESPRILLLLAIAATLSALSTQVLIPFYQALDVLRTLVVIILAEAAVHIALSVSLARSLGLPGVAVATVVPALLITAVFAPRFMLPRLRVGFHEFLRLVIAPAAAVSVASLATQSLASMAIGMDSYPALVVRVCASGAVVLPVLMLTLPREDWGPIVSRLAPLLARRRAR